jgi:hypothetical protein
MLRPYVLCRTDFRLSNREPALMRKKETTGSSVEDRTTDGPVALTVFVSWLG